MRSIWRKMALGLALVISGAAAGAVAVAHLAPTFGGRVSGERLARAEASPHYTAGRFVNIVPQAPRDVGMIWELAKRQYGGTEQRHPLRPIPVVSMPSGNDSPRTPAPGLRTVWFGHATVYIELDGQRLLVDPVLSDYASPIAGIGPKRFHPPPLALEALPFINAVLISHDHYDHLDMRTVKHLVARGTHFFVPLGVGAHLDRWGVPAGLVTELDWWQSAKLGDITLTATPVRHYSGRALRDANATLWSSWVMAGASARVYFSGDTGAGDHFKAIGDRLGPFDLSLIKIGAYGPGQTWRDVHMEPEDAVAAHVAMRAKRMLPVHWGTYNLAFHAWDEPIERTVAAAGKAGVELVTPRIGEVVTAGVPFTSQTWWRP